MGQGVIGDRTLYDRNSGDSTIIRGLEKGVAGMPRRSYLPVLSRPAIGGSAGPRFHPHRFHFMLTHFIKAKFFVLIVLVALFAGLAFFSTDYDSRGGTVGPACQIKVYGRCYRDQEVRRMVSYFEVARNLLLIEFAGSLFGENRLDSDPTDFVTNLIILRHEAARLGIEPTDEEAKEAIRTAPIFSIQTMINDEILESNVLAPRGLTKADLVQLGKDYLCWRKLGDLLEAGNAPVPVELEKAYVREYQQFTASMAEFSIDAYREKAVISDEEIQKYYDDNKEDLLSDEKRGATLVRFTPPAETEGMTAEQKAEQRLAFNNRVNEIYGTLAEDETKFADLAKGLATDPANKFPIAVEEIAAFAQVSPPEALKDKTDLLTDLFSGARNIEAGVAVSVPFPQEDGSYVMFKLTQIVKPVPLTLEEAKAQIKTALANQKSNLLVNEAATAARTKVLEALEAGKPASEAAKAAGIELKPLPAFSESQPPAGIDAAEQLVQAAQGTAKGSVSEVLPMTLGKGYRFLVVDKIELVESEEVDERKTSIRISAASEYRRAMYQAWFAQRLKASGATRAGSVADQNLPADGEPAAPAES